MSKNIFLFTRFENNTGGDEALLKTIVSGLAKGKTSKEIAKMDVFVRCDEASKERVEKLQEKLSKLTDQGIKINIIPCIADNKSPYPAGLARNLTTEVGGNYNNLVNEADLFVVAGWGDMQKDLDAQYIIDNVKKEGAKVLVCCAPGASLDQSKSSLKAITDQKGKLKIKETELEKKIKEIEEIKPENSELKSGLNKIIELTKKINEDKLGSPSSLKEVQKLAEEIKKIKPSSNELNDIKIKSSIVKCLGNISRVIGNIKEAKDEIEKLNKIGVEYDVFMKKLLESELKDRVYALTVKL